MRKVISIFALLAASLAASAQFSTVSCTHGETGTCRQATSCSQANVQATVTASSAGTDGYISPTSFHGDGVYVPSGSCSWSSSVSWTDKNINVIGSVGGTTTITPSGDMFDVSFTNAAGNGSTTAAAFRISGFTQNGGHFFNANTSNPNMTGLAGFFRIDNNVCNTSAGGNNFIIYGPVYGVFDHNNCTVSGGNIFEQAMFLNSEFPPSTAHLMGETVGRTFAIGLGDQNAVYAEDNTFNCSGSYGSGALSDSESGPQRWVLRHNNISGTCYMYAHWTRNGEWDGGRIEVYNNTFNCNGSGCPGGYPGRFDAGTGVIFNNTIIGYGTTSFQIDEARGCGAQTGGDAGQCAGNPGGGNSTVDVNAGDASAPGWPCGGQVGTACIAGSCTRGNMNSVPFIMWNNGAQAGCSTGGSCTNSITFNVDGPPGGGSCTRTMTNYLSSTAHSLSGPYNGAIDYFSGASKPSSVGIYTGIASYTSFTYPYPTTTSGTNFSLTVTATNGSVSGSNCSTNTYASGTAIGPCTATPNTGFLFTGWSGTGACSGVSGTGTASCTLTANSTLTANFTPMTTVATPTFTQNGNWVTISTTTTGASCYYTVNSSTPTTSSALYTHPLYTVETVTYKALCAKAGSINSAVGTQGYTIAVPTTRFSMSTTSSSTNPIPFPPDNRACCGSNVAAVEPSRGSYSLTVLHNWISQSTSNGSAFWYTIQGFPTWMTGQSVTMSAPPSDLHTTAACQAPLLGSTTTDCSMKEFVAKLVLDRTGLSSFPATPQVCAHLDYLEVINEFNTDDASGSTGWTGTYADLAVVANDISAMAHAGCSNTVVVGGSASGIVGFHSNGENGHFDVALLTLYQDWAALTSSWTPNGTFAGPSLFDMSTFHGYPARGNVAPVPFPWTNTSTYSGCTAGSANCYIAVNQEGSQVQGAAVLQNASIASWASNIPVASSEGGYGTESQLPNLSGGTVLTQNYVSQYMVGLAAQKIPIVMLYAANDSTWGCYWACPTTSPWLPSFTNTQAALNNFVFGSCSTVSSVFTCSGTYTGSPASLVYYEPISSSTTYTTSFNRSLNLVTGAVNTLTGSTPLDNGPQLLYSVVTPPTNFTITNVPISGSVSIH